ncbi:MAG TPA: FAD-binding oxidoreductase [Candidatus Cloacimonetes bacterium]|nr:FAD-binding oxidoreductase [Candidatus Cloacimonadota bacterium]HHE40219.1 FAD-binding oxidoreductase [Candidatus Cloacimonadota bacterium]
MDKNFDIIVIGAGSVGVPIALYLAEKKFSVLVIESLASPGQGQNKKAIGGIRATHSDKAKIHISLESIDIFSTWKEMYGDDIEWRSNGYSFPAYTDAHEQLLKDLLKIQKRYGLNIDWISAKEFLERAPGVNPDGLRGSTFSPEDGSASPYLALNYFYFKSMEYGASYVFKEEVSDIIKEGSGYTVKTRTNKSYSAKYIVNAAGNNARQIGEMVGLDIPVVPDSHEGGITDAVQHFFDPMIVDLRPAENSKNYYFYQRPDGQVIFCITPEPPIVGTDSRATSVFLPQVTKRMLELFPCLKNLKVRRTWRGQYPATPDGFPILGETDIDGFYLAVGMCGQGFMLGPGIGKLFARLFSNSLSDDDKDNLKSLSLYRNFGAEEKFK